MHPPEPQYHPFKRVGVIGGGQLAQMMAEAAQPLNLELIVQTPHISDPAVLLATDVVLGALGDLAATSQLAAKCDVITFENEFVELAPLSVLVDQGVRFRPPLEALQVLLDKYDQFHWLQTLGLPVPPCKAFTSVEDLLSQGWDFPLVLKARRHGYDGQGTWIISDQAHLKTVIAQLGSMSLLVQGVVPFERELAVIGARSAAGDIALYPIVETYQQDQVCHWAIAPAHLTASTVQAIETIAQTILTNLQGIGIFAIELFLTATGNVLINEIAPRTHNSGHFSIDACETSQFEQHLRAVCNLPLGNPGLIQAGAIMVNLLGYEYAQSDYPQQRQTLAQIPNATVHWYGKTEARPGRKLGHVTVLLQESTAERRQVEALAIAHQVEAIWY
ncbi:MAG: 5-(carboxyamino)imidazole ribonucleotide synthase [Oscillatoriales cyanobacterium RM2_1_1]|nr:5-(carboxyamino)imidazole ribonucleotide synthase [Oscillatoriales cyanobacterium SM2_3_0]NJO46950.1 5-(carboxyamino)imidazole ribonucleotide synthase [Oscillatoriales cyanobacterium RM2_1_1]